MANGIYLAKVGSKLVAADEKAQRVINKMEHGEAKMFKPMSVRDINAHRRYWKLMDVCADNCERIEIASGRFMEVNDREDVHTAIKLCTGYYDTIFDGNNKPMARVVRSTSFEEMTKEEWDEYWPKVLRIVEERIIPGVQISDVIVEIHNLMGLRNA